MTRGNAIIVAIQDYEQHPQREEVAVAASALAQALTEHGIPTVRSGGTSQELQKNILSWLRDAGHEDRLFLYWSSHGGREADGFYLITQESPTHNLNTDNAIDPRSIAKGAANSNAKRVLIIFDACFSGEAIADMGKTISRILSAQAPSAGSRRGIAVLASAHALQFAQGGLFSNLLKDLLTDRRIARRWSDEDRFIDYDRLVASLSDEIERRGIIQDFVPSAIGSTIELLPNPLHRPGQAAEVVEERTWRLVQSSGAAHFDLAARGIEVGASGWYFAGRRRLLRELIAWLESAQHGVRIVTGAPGSGKSAVMGRLATLSDPDYRNAALRAGVIPLIDNGTIPPERIIDVAIHAKGKTLDNCARDLAKNFGLSTAGEAAIDIDAVVAAVGTIPRRLTIMIDGLDEAASGHGYVIAERLIVPLANQDRVRVLVGSRRTVDGSIVPQGQERHSRLRAVFGTDVPIDDLEDEQETHEDIAEYVRLRLAASAKHRDDTPGIEAAAERVADRADGVFLYARIVSRTLQDLDRLDGELPTTALAAFANDIRTRFETNEQLVDDLLAALAWGEGKGLTRRTWPQVAEALTRHRGIVDMLAGRKWPRFADFWSRRGRSYEDDHVAWILGNAGWHIIEAGEDGQAVYRLAHQALADYYRDRLDMQKAQSWITAALTNGIAGAAWLDCDRYIWRHLADHAVQADRLDALVRDPCYLAVADPTRLVAILPRVEEKRARGFAGIYNRVADRLVGQSPLDRLPLIHMTALMEAPALASAFVPPLPTRWLCRWVRGAQPSTPHRVIGRHSSNVNAIAIDMGEERELVVSGNDDGTLRFWDGRTGTPLGQPLRGHTDRIKAVAFGLVDGRPIVVSGGSDETLRLWDARSGTPIGEPLRGHRGSVFTVAFATVGSSPVIASGSYDETIRLWDARTGTPIGQPLEGHANSVTALAFGEVDGRAVLISGSDDQTIRIWDAHGRVTIGQSPKDLMGRVTSVAFGIIEKRAVVVCGSGDRTIRLLDARTAMPIGPSLEGHTGAVTAVALGAGGDVASGSDDKTARLWSGRDGQSVGRPLEGHTASVAAVALSGTRFLTAGDRTIRLWELQSEESFKNVPAGHEDQITSVVVAVVDARAIVISGSWDQTIRLWDACTGEPIGLFQNRGRVIAVAHGVVDGRAVVVSASSDLVRLWDVRTGSALGEPFCGHSGAVTAVALGSIDGRAVVVSGSADKSVCLWDVNTELANQRQRESSTSPRSPIQKRLIRHTGGVTSVALGAVEDRVLVVSGSRDKTVRLWDARTGAAIGRPLEGHEGAVTAVALGAVDDCAIIASGGRDHTIRLWDARTGTAIGKPLEGHTSDVTSISFCVVQGRTILMSASEDGTIRHWNTRTHIGEVVASLGGPIRAIYRCDAGLAVGMERALLCFDFQREAES
ncbi:WD40 repeat domain-containing protein [Bradyrhizobium sp. 18BD]